MVELEKVVKKVWEHYKENFWLLSLGVVVSLVIAELLYALGQYLVGQDLVVTFLVSSFLMGGVYITARYAVKPGTTADLSLIMARYVLAYSIFVLLVVAGLLFPSPLSLFAVLFVVSLFYVAVPIVAELGLRDGWKKIEYLVKNHLVSYVGLNWLLFLSLYAIIALAVSPILSIIMMLLLLFLYLPVYSLTGYYLAHLGRRSV